MLFRRVPQCAVCAPFIALVLSAQTVSLHYQTVSSDTIARRLQLFKNTNSEREQEVHSLFEESGCNGDNLAEQPVKHAHDPNVICTLPGASDSRILIGAHFDFINAGRGVVDNWSGCSLLPSLYQSLKTAASRHTFVFIAFTDEEKGLVGSKFYVHSMTKDDLGRISAMINLDSLGTNPTKLELTRGDKQLANALGRIAGSLHLPLDVVNVHQVGRSDSDSFQDRHVPTLMVHSITQQTWPILHTAQDQMAAIRLTDYYDTYRLLAAYLAYLDATLDVPTATPQ